MKKMKKIVSLVLALVMVLSMATTVFAAGNATITIQNAAKGETYKVVKLFDASVTGTTDGSIAYTGNIPDTLTNYFTTDAAGNISSTATALSEEAIAAMKAWAETQTATAEQTGDGTVVVFDGLDYGYYVVLTTQGAAITVTSTNPNATVYDKNTEEPYIVKTVNDTEVYIGQTLTYTVNYLTSNYLDEDNDGGSDAAKVVRYEIIDTLPKFLSNVTVVSIVVDLDGDLTTTEAEDRVTLSTQQFDENNKISIPRVDDDGKSLYDNGAQVIITYTATVTAEAVVGKTDATDEDLDKMTEEEMLAVANVNTVTLQPYVDDGNGGTPWEETWEDDERIYTYAAALIKVDEEKAPLAGAEFAANGLKVTGETGNYTVKSFDVTSTELGDVMTTDDDGNLVIKGLPSDVTLIVTETKAPAGYNKLVDTVALTPTLINEVITATTTTVYYDENGDVTNETTDTFKKIVEYNTNLKSAAIKVENNKGSILPETGGIGTTIFYTTGIILILGAVVLLVTKKRMKTMK